MSKINFKVRFKNKAFIIGLVSALVILAQQVGGLFGYEISEVVSQQIMDILNTLLGILVAIGVISDPTTKGIGDSERAKSYKELG